MSETWQSITAGGHHVRNVERLGDDQKPFCWRGEMCLNTGLGPSEDPRDWRSEVWYDRGYCYLIGPRSDFDLVAINEGATVTDIELIEADQKSIYEAQRCLESMKSLQGDRDLRRDFDIVWMDLTTLRTRLQRKLDKLKNEGGAK